MIAISELLLWAIVSCAIGCCVVDLCSNRGYARLGVLQICLGFGVGSGASAIVYFISLNFFGSRSLVFLWIEIIILAVLLVVRLLRSRDYSSTGEMQVLPMPYRDVLIPILTITGCAFLLLAILRGLAFVHGGWDAWVIWNMRARWIFRSGSDWSASAFSPLLANTDYPLFLPSTVLQGWNTLKSDSTVVPIAVGIAFELGLVALLFAALWRLSSPMKAILATGTLMATPLFVELAGYQYADVPIAYFFLATLVFIGLHDYAFPGDQMWLVLAGFSAGVCCWTKNEGVLFLIVLVLARTVTARSIGMKKLVQELLFIGAGALVPVALLFYFKHTLAPPSAMFGQQQVGGFASQIFDASRHATIVPAFLRQSLNFGGWKISLLPFLAIYAVISGVDLRQRQRRFLLTCIVVLTMMLAGYYAVYLTEALPTADLQRHLDSSLDRLLFQLWPIFLLIYFLAVRSPIPEQVEVVTDVG